MLLGLCYEGCSRTARPTDKTTELPEKAAKPPDRAAGPRHRTGEPPDKKTGPLLVTAKKTTPRVIRLSYTAPPPPNLNLTGGMQDN